MAADVSVKAPLKIDQIIGQKAESFHSFRDLDVIDSEKPE